MQDASVKAAQEAVIAARQRLSALVDKMEISGNSMKSGPNADVCTESNTPRYRAAAQASSRSPAHCRAGDGGMHRSLWPMPSYSWIRRDRAFNNVAGHVVHVLTPRRASAEKRRLQR